MQTGSSVCACYTPAHSFRNAQFSARPGSLWQRPCTLTCAKKLRNTATLLADAAAGRCWFAEMRGRGRAPWAFAWDGLVGCRIGEPVSGLGGFRCCTRPHWAHRVWSFPTAAGPWPWERLPAVSRLQLVCWFAFATLSLLSGLHQVPRPVSCRVPTPFSH